LLKQKKLWREREEKSDREGGKVFFSYLFPHSFLLLPLSSGTHRHQKQKQENETTNNLPFHLFTRRETNQCIFNLFLPFFFAPSHYFRYFRIR